jgi:glycerophosphoryl diester phosphodiesterase
LKLIVLLLLLIFICCSDSSDQLDMYDMHQSTIILGHKGSGIEGKYWNEGLIENTMNSIQNAFELLDGAECDLQLSLDGSFWVFHDFEVKVSEKEKSSIAKLNDAHLKEISKYFYHGNLMLLDDLIDSLNKSKFASKTLLLDLKFLMEGKSVERYQNSDLFVKEIVRKIESSKQKAAFELFVEVYQLKHFKLFKAHSNIDVSFVRNEKDALNFSNKEVDAFSISLNYRNLNDIKFKKKNFRLGLWNANSVDDMIYANSFCPHYILSDNIPLSQFFIKLRNSNLGKKELVFQDFEMNSQGKNTLVFKYSLEPNDSNFIFRFSPTLKYKDSNIKLFFWAENQNGKTVLWKVHKLANKKWVEQFIDVNVLRKNSISEVIILAGSIPKKPYKLHGFKLEKLYFNE